MSNDASASTTGASRHRVFAQLHEAGTFVLPNVYDAGSAALAEAAGAKALATTSSGHGWSIGRHDGVGDVSRDESLARLRIICDVTTVPVSVDAENGWCHDPEGVADTIHALADAGASGATIEDWSCDSSKRLYDPSHATERVAAAVEAANSRNEPFVVCARAEALIRTPPGAADPAEMLDGAIERLRSFAEVGAHCLYAPGTRDLTSIGRVAAEAGGPINALIGYGSALTVADAESVGVRRISVGGSLYRAAAAYFSHIVGRTVDEGRFDVPYEPLVGTDLDTLFDNARSSRP